MGSMYMSDVLLNQDLISTGYQKYWPVETEITALDLTRREMNPVAFRERSQSCGMANRERRKAEFKDSAMVEVNTNAEADTANLKDDNNVEVRINRKMNNFTDKGGGKNQNSGFARLDMKTLQNIGWVSGANNEKKQNTVTDAEAFCKLTKVEFRKLQEQVRDVSTNLKNRFRTSAYQLPPCDTPASNKKLYQRPNGETTNQVYRSQLAASLKAFQQKQWPPLNRQELDPNFFRCKPVERPQTSCSVRTNFLSRLQRPKSVPASSLRPKSSLTRRSDTPSDIRPGKFDTLSPLVISDLMGPTERPTSDYEGSADDKSPLIDVIASETKQLLDNDDASTTSGIDSGASENESPSEEEDSDYEPEIDPHINIPQLNLRPEKLDAIYIPEPKRGWRQYDFDMSNIDEPPYTFRSPLPDFMKQIDLKKIAKDKGNWRNDPKLKSGVRDQDLEGIIDRMVEFEKLQLDTIEWENKRAAQMKKAAFKRVNSAKIKDKRCDSQCLQATCFGDCPEKLVQSNSCESCRQGFCTGNCKEVKYDQRMRQPRMEDERQIPPKSPFPRACTTCQRKHNAKFINANNLILGSQRLNNATYTRGQGSAKVKDLRPKTPSTFPNDILKEFEKLNLDTTQQPRPMTSSSTSRPRSRNAMYPGKSFSSQRKNSLTDLDKIVTPKKKKTKPATRVKRPKTAG